MRVGRRLRRRRRRIQLRRHLAHAIGRLRAARVTGVWVSSGCTTSQMLAVALVVGSRSGQRASPWPRGQAALREVISGIADHPVNRIAEFFPWHLDGIRLRLDQPLAAWTPASIPQPRSWPDAYPGRHTAAGSQARPRPVHAHRRRVRRSGRWKVAGLRRLWSLRSGPAALLTFFDQCLQKPAGALRPVQTLQRGWARPTQPWIAGTSS